VPDRHVHTTAVKRPCAPAACARATRSAGGHVASGMHGGKPMTAVVSCARARPRTAPGASCPDTFADAEPPEEARHAALDTRPMLTLAPGRASVILEYSAKRQPMTKLLELALDRLSRQSAA
jgi:hypothetical protein